MEAEGCSAEERSRSPAAVEAPFWMGSSMLSTPGDQVIPITELRGEIAEAQRQLTALKNAPENSIPTCMAVLGSSAQPYALMAAASPLSDLVTEHWQRFTGAQALEERELNGGGRYFS